MAKTYKFKAEINKLLDLMINSLYSHKEIFLRELISNASDAIDKLKFQAITQPELLENDSEFKIKIIPDKKNKTLTISDNGIGMDKDEIVKSLGTIAHSDTEEFLKLLKEKNIKENIELIGQFGVGFYSSFMVAEKVEVISRKAGVPENQAVKWTSSGDGKFSVEDVAKSSRGTDVILYLKKEDEKYLEEYEIRNIVKKYSDYIEYPIVLVTDGKEEVLNSQKAIWLKDKSEISEDEYKEFYKHITHDFMGEPLEIIHFKLEGLTEFTALLFIPKKAPYNIFFKDYKIGPALYVKKVQIMENCEDLIPPYLRFIKGVVECDDLPLNISREMLQANKQVQIIRKNIVSKVLEKLKQMKENEKEKYEQFYKEFRKVLKEGIHIDFENSEKIAELLFFESTKTEKGKFTDLENYIKNMKNEQKEIYYITGSSREEIENSPYLEVFKEKDYEVLFMTDEIDDFIFTGFEYKGKKFKNILKGEVEIDKEKSEAKEKAEKEFKDLLTYIKNRLRDEIADVKFSSRLKESPCCLVTGEFAPDPQTEKILKSLGQTLPDFKKTLELNPQHKLIEKLNKLYSEKNYDELNELIEVLYDQALILEGDKPKNPAQFVNRISKYLCSQPA